MSNVYSNPEEFGLEIVDELEDPSASYSYNKLVVWKHIKTKKLFWAEDSGCSCPSPFENYSFSAPNRTTLSPMNSSKKEFKLAVENHPAGISDKDKMLEMVKKLLTKPKPLVVKQRERIAQFKLDPYDYGSISGPLPLNDFFKLVSKGLKDKLKEIKTLHGNSFDNIQVEFSTSIEEYTYPDDVDVPGLIFTGIRKD